MDAPPPRPPRDDDDPPDVDVDDVVVHEEGGSLDAVDEIVRLARMPGQHPSTSGVLTTAADRLREVLTREGGVDGHEVLDVMVSSLDVRARDIRSFDCFVALSLSLSLDLFLFILFPTPRVPSVALFFILVSLENGNPPLPVASPSVSCVMHPPSSDAHRQHPILSSIVM